VAHLRCWKVNTPLRAQYRIWHSPTTITAGTVAFFGTLGSVLRGWSQRELPSIGVLCAHERN
jgi:hypothetical protein